MCPMEVLGPGPVVVLCHACGVVSAHHPFVKPLSPRWGLVCSRCGHVNTWEECCGYPKTWHYQMELNG